jgi:hypothetical protein
MISFTELKESLAKTKKMKIDGITVEIQAVKDKFKVKVDGDYLDTYASEKEAEKMAKEFVKQIKG